MDKKAFLEAIILENSAVLQTLGLSPVLVALSGGADSVALLRCLLELGCRCIAVHCNFHLRGEESMRDERFVRALCGRLDVPLTVRDFDVAAYRCQHGVSVEMACRELRYAWFEQERQRQGCALIAVAHHADDQVETFVLNLLRGTGIKGLTGMSRAGGHVWRPLIGLRHGDLLDYLASLGQDYVTDSTNAQNDYRRNRIRNLVLPAMELQFPQARHRILDTMDHLREDHRLLSSLVDEILPDDSHIDLRRLVGHPQAVALLYHRIRHHGFNPDQCRQAVQAAARGHTGSRFIGRRAILVINRNSIDIEPMETDEQVLIPLDLTTDLFSPVNISINHNNAPFSPRMCNGRDTVAFNTQLLECRQVTLRHWRRGDRIKPYGMKGSKLVSDLFADFKLSHAAKREAWLLEADGEILWVLGYRAAALYPVDAESQDYLLLHLHTQHDTPQA